MTNIYNICSPEISLSFLLESETEEGKANGTKNNIRHKEDNGYIVSENDQDKNDIDFHLSDLNDIPSIVDNDKTILCNHHDDSESISETCTCVNSSSILKNPSSELLLEENENSFDAYPSMCLDIFQQESSSQSEGGDVEKTSSEEGNTNTLLLTPTETLFPPLTLPEITSTSTILGEISSDLVTCGENISNSIDQTRHEEMRSILQDETCSPPNIKTYTFSQTCSIDSDLSSPASSEDGGQFNFSASDEDTFYTRPGSEEDEILTNPSSEEDELHRSPSFVQNEHVSVDDLFLLFNPPTTALYHSATENSLRDTYDNQRNAVWTGKKVVGETRARHYRCKDCGKEFGRAFHLKRHRIIHTGQKPYKCQSCEKTFHDISHLRAHSVVHSGAKPFKCGHCGKEFNRKYNLDTHVMTHNSNYQPFSCKICKKTFRRHSNLVIHARIHSEEKPYPCNQCDKTFHIKSSLKRHLLTHW